MKSSEQIQTDLDKRLRQIISACPWYETLPSIRELNLPDWWVAGGAVRNTVWMALYGDACTLKIKDLDVVFFDKNSQKDFEVEQKEKLHQLHPQWVFDVKNQASFGHWRTWQFQFKDSTDGIDHFLHTATAVGVRLNDRDQLDICKPHGLEDLFNGVIRLTPYRHGEEAANTRQKQFLENCPGLTLAD